MTEMQTTELPNLFRFDDGRRIEAFDATAPNRKHWQTASA
jgi:hypothetical protein